jgi:hypothetical protein
MTLAVYDISSNVSREQLTAQARDDLTVMVAGQGGDGSLTIIALLSRALLRRGYSIYRSSNIASRINRNPQLPWGKCGHPGSVRYRSRAESVRQPEIFQRGHIRQFP